MNAELHVDVELPGAWAALCEPALRPAAERAVAATLDALAQDFAVPAAAVVHLHAGPAALNGGQWPLLRCGDVVLPCSAALGARVHAHLQGLPLQAEHFAPPLPSPAHLAALCGELLRQRPALLLGAAQVQLLVDEHGVPLSDGDTRDFAALLERLLAQRIGLSDLPAIKRCWQEGRADRLPVERMAEALIDTRMADPVHIHASGHTLREITERASVLAPALATRLRDDAYFDLGIAYPDFRFVVDDTLSQRAFSFRVRALRTLPAFGWDAAAPADARVLHPATLEPWNDDADGLGYLMACLSAELRRLAPCFVSRAELLRALDEPAAVDSVLARQLASHHTPEAVTDVLRRLAAERVSVRNLRLIAERLCDVDHVVADAASLVVFDPRLPVANEPEPGWNEDPHTLCEFVRMGLRTQLSHALDRGNEGLGVYLVEREVEQALAALPRDGHLNEADWAALLRGVRDARGTGRESETSFVMLTTTEARAALHAHVKHAFPAADVVAYQELVPQMALHALARVGFSR